MHFWLGRGGSLLQRSIYDDALSDLQDRLATGGRTGTARAYFYVDNIFVFTPLQAVQTMYYLPVDFYRYFIGRNDQSVNESLMIKRIDQPIKVNKILVDELNLDQLTNPDLRSYLLNHVETTTIISCALLNRGGTAEHMMKKKEFWHYIQDNNPSLLKIIRNGLLGQLTNLYGYPGRKISNAVYKIAKRIYGFN